MPSEIDKFLEDAEKNPALWDYIEEMEAMLEGRPTVLPWQDAGELIEAAHAVRNKGKKEITATIVKKAGFRTNEPRSYYMDINGNYYDDR